MAMAMMYVVLSCTIPPESVSAHRGMIWADQEKGLAGSGGAKQ